MAPAAIKLTLNSAATFGRGDGVAGQVDREIEHDVEGFPFLRGRTLKGLLAESAENVVFALEELQHRTGWREAKNTLFGKPGPGIKERGILHVGNAECSPALRAAVREAGWKPDDVLFSLTGIRRQTSVNVYGAPQQATLRTMRVLLPGITIVASISFDRSPEPRELQILTSAVMDLRRAGTDRNRGRGWLQADLDNEEVTQKYFKEFMEAVR